MASQLLLLILTIIFEAALSGCQRARKTFDKCLHLKSGALCYNRFLNHFQLKQQSANKRHIPLVFKYNPENTIKRRLRHWREWNSFGVCEITFKGKFCEKAWGIT